MKRILMGLYIVWLPLFAMAQLPLLQTEKNIRFIEGGVGLSESDAMKAESSRWPVKLVFSRVNGQKSEWVSNASLTILDSKGTPVFSRQVDGPMILINLKPGKYLVQSVYQGQSKSTHLNVINGEPLNVNIEWQ